MGQRRRDQAHLTNNRFIIEITSSEKFSNKKVNGLTYAPFFDKLNTTRFKAKLEENGDVRDQ